MPTLFRLLVFVALVAAAVYGAMYALAHFVEPRRTEMTIEIAPERFTQPDAPNGD